MIIGHTHNLEFFAKVIEQGNLSHAYLFVGPESVGKRTVAEHLAAKILGVDTVKLKNQPDFTIVEQGINEKTGKTKKNIDVEQIRELRSALGRHAFLGGYKIALIDRAEKMNAASANALLKTLEEPKPKTVLFLITSDEAMLTATVLSRCQMIYFHTVATDVIASALSFGRGNIDEAARLSAGRPGRAISWLKDEDAYSAHKQEIVRFLNLHNKSFHDKIKAVEDLFGKKEDHIAARQKLQNILNLWKLLLRDSLVHEDAKVHKVPFKMNIEIKKMLRVERRINEAIELLNKNVHPRLLVDNILLEMN